MQQFFSQQEYETYQYKKSLKNDANKVGGILLIFFAVMTIMSVIVTYIPIFYGLIKNGFDFYSLDLSFIEDTTFLMILSSVVSLVAFFTVSIIYSIIAKQNLGYIYPVKRVGFKITALMCGFGLAVGFVANYVSNMLIAVFDFIGIDAYTDISYECDTALDVILFYVSVAVLPALVEEFAFRGVILGSLRKHSDSLAILVSGVMFGLMHGNFTQIPFALVVGLVLGYIAVKTNSLIPGIIIHFINNALSVTLTLISENDNFSDAVLYAANGIITFLVAAVGIICFIILSTNYRSFFKLSSADDNISFKEKVLIVCKSPTLIAFTVLCFVEAILTIFLEL